MPKPKALPRILAATNEPPATLDTNERQAAFVSYYAKSGINGAEAARLAGYSAPAQTAYRLLSLPHVKQRIRQQRETIIQGDLAKLALETLGQLMTSETTPAAVRHSCARTSLEMSGHLGKGPETALADKALGEMTIEELQRFIEAGEDALASVKVIPAKVVNAPLNAPKAGGAL